MVHSATYKPTVHAIERGPHPVWIGLVRKWWILPAIYGIFFWEKWWESIGIGGPTFFQTAKSGPEKSSKIWSKLGSFLPKWKGRNSEGDGYRDTETENRN